MNPKKEVTIRMHSIQFGILAMLKVKIGISGLTFYEQFIVEWLINFINKRSPLLICKINF